MGEKNSKSASNVSTNSTAKSERRIDDQSNRRCLVQNYLLVWVDTNVRTLNADSQNVLKPLRSVFNDVDVFIEPEECVHFLEGIPLEKVFLIVSKSLGRDLIPRIHAMTQIYAIYIFCGGKSRHEEWVKEWPKVKGVYTKIEPICSALEVAVKQCNQDLAGLSFMPIGEDGTSKINLNQLEPSFMYTQLFKHILLDMEPDWKKTVQDLVKYCQERHAGNPTHLELIYEFGHKYHPSHAIWWYTREGFAYQMLDRALRLLEAEVIVNMGFFICDLHQQIQQLHEEQIGDYRGELFLVYRGQGLSTTNFEKLKKSQGGADVLQLLPVDQYEKENTHRVSQRSRNEQS